MEDTFDNGMLRYQIAEQAAAQTAPAWQAFGFDSEEQLREWLKKGEQHETSE